MSTIAVVGNLSLDRVAGSRPRIGGGPYHAARALRLVGARARLVARCADGDRRFLLPRLAALGIPLRLLAGETTAAFSFTYDHGVRTMNIDVLGDAWTPDDVRTLDRHVRWVQVAPLARSDFPSETIAQLAQGRRVLLDGQGLVRKPQTGRLELDADFDRDVLEHVSILKLAEEEARTLVGEPDESALRSLGVPEVVVTLGSEGSLVLADGKLEKVPAQAAGEVDPTGAGDAFSAVYLASRSSGHAPAAAARRATALVAGLLARRIP
jgi:sugar/nucleoside kinase (ribokinase family)